MTKTSVNQKRSKKQADLIKDEAPAQYFTGYWRTPNIVDMLALTPNEFRLYLHYRRICGDSGTCWQGVREIAKTCKMSKTTIIAAKRTLAEAGLIRIEATMRETRGTQHRAEVITLVDIWQLNYEFCANKKERVGKKEVTRGVVPNQGTTLVPNQGTKEYPPIKNTPSLVINITDKAQLKDLEKGYEFIKANFTVSNNHILETALQLAREYSPAWLLRALQRAGDKGRFDLAYVRGILGKWKVNGFDSLLPVATRKNQGRKPPANTFASTDPRRYLGQKYDGLVRR